MPPGPPVGYDAPMSEEAEPGVTLEEAAQKLGVSIEDVRGLVAAGELAAHPGAPTARVTSLSVLLYLTKQVRVVTEPFTRPRPSAVLEVLGAMGVNLLLVLWALGTLVEAFSLRAHKPLVPPLAVVAASVVMVGLAALLASRQSALSSTNGVGTTLYGRRRTEHGDVGTAWLIFGGLPLVPLRSYIILEKHDEESDIVFQKKSYVLRALPAIHWPQAAPLLLLGWAVVAALLSACVLA